MKRFILFIASILIAGCGSQSNISPESTELSFTPSSLPSSPTNIAISPTAVILPTNEPEATEVIEIGIEERELDEDGPWLFFYDYGVMGFWLSNSDGTGLMDLEINLDGRIWDLSKSKYYFRVKNNYLAVIDVEDKILWIFHLPNGEFVRKIPLIGKQAQEVIDTYDLDLGYGAPVSNAVGQIRWSHDGRSLAFVGVMVGTSSDIYVYDIDSDSIQRLTFSSDEVALLGWSPDNQEVLYYSVSYFTELSMDVIALSSVSLNEDQVELFQYDQRIEQEVIVGWINSDAFYSYTRFPDSMPKNLKMINIRIGAIDLIVDGYFEDVEFDSVSGNLYVGFTQELVDYLSEPLQEKPGMYQLNLDDMSLKNLFFNYKGFYSWSMGNKAYVSIVFDDKAEIYDVVNRKSIYTGENWFYENSIYISPDQVWLFVNSKNGGRIFDAQMKDTKNILVSGKILWIEDSSGFYLYDKTNDGLNVYLVLEENEWDPILVNHISIKQDFSFVTP